MAEQKLNRKKKTEYLVATHGANHSVVSWRSVSVFLYNFSSALAYILNISVTLKWCSMVEWDGLYSNCMEFDKLLY